MDNKDDVNTRLWISLLYTECQLVKYSDPTHTYCNRCVCV